MAILRGFPPSNTISPSVRIAEKDLSFVPAEQRFNRAGLVGFATKGPVNSPTLIRTARHLHQVFGFPDPTISAPYLIYAAEQYLQISTEVWIVRVADIDPVSSDAAETASVDVLSAGGAVTIVGNGTTPFTFGDIDGDGIVDDRMFRWRLNGVLSQKTLVVLADNNRESPYTGVAYTAALLVDELNSQLTSEDGIEFYVSGTKIGVRTTFSFGPTATLELVSCRNSLYGPGISINAGSGARVFTNPSVGLGLSMYPAQVVSNHDRYPNNSYQTVGNYDFTGGAVTLDVVVDGTDNVNIDNVVQTVVISAASYTTLSLVTAVNSYIAAHLPGGFRAYKTGNNFAITTQHTGRDARLLIKSSSTAALPLSLDTDTKIGSGTTGVASDLTTYNNAIVSGSVNTSTVIMTINADSPGTAGNSTQVVITNNIRDGDFTMDVYSGGVQVESWGALVRDQTERLYVESFLAIVSNYIRVSDVTTVTGLPAAGTYTLVGGSDGIPSDPDDQDSLIIGNDVAMTGLQAFSEPEQIDIDLLAIPGFSSTAAVNALIDVCQNKRMDALAIIDPPFGFTVEEIVAWQNGVHTLNSTRFDSDFAALYWPWVKIRDTTNRIDVWVPPSGCVIATYVRSDDLGAPWMAPAGMTRGIVPNILDVYSKPNLEERDLMYGYRNAVNPIISFPGIEGFLIWGQKTLQRRPTALDRVNVRRLMFYLEKRVRQESRNLLFEPHDQELRRQFVSISSRILSQVKVLRGLNDYIVKCDEELNTVDVIDRNEMRARIGVQPTRAAEFIYVEFSIHRTGTFSENADTF
jgi:phage tail sheath protein FI